MLFRNPVFWRELLDRLRSSKTLLTMLAIAMGSCGLVYLRWPTDSRLDVVSQGAMEVFRPLAYALTLAIMLMVPAFPATALVSERRRGTMALLLNSPLRPFQIYLGKWLSNIALAMFLVSVSLPALSACYAMGGISLWSHILPLLLVLLGMAVQYSAVGLWVSIRSNTSDASLRWTYVAILGLAVLSIGPLAIVGKLSGLSGWLAHFLTTLSPLSALQQITGTQSKVAELGITSGWVEFLWGAAVVTVICAAATLTKLDPILLDRTKSRGRVRLADDPEGSRFRRFQYLVDPEKRSAGIPRWLNPVLVKEFRTRRFGRLHWLIRIVAVCAILSLILTVVSASGTVNWGVQRIAAMMVLMQVAMLLLLGPSLSSSLIAGEIESGGWQILRTTPLRPMRILSGKFMSVVWTVLLLLLATLPGYVVMGFIVPAMVGQVNNVLLSLILVAWVVISVSACVSAFARNTAVATIISYVLLILLFAGTLVVWLARGKPFGPILVERVLTFNPVATALAEIKAPGFEGYQLAPASWWISAGISLGCTLILMIRTWQLSRSD